METELEHLLISTHKAEMIAHMATHPEQFDEAVKLAISDKQPYSWRAAWLLWSCMEKNDRRIQKYLQDIIGTLIAKNDDHQRELIKILHQMKLSEEYEGFLFDLCAAIWKKTDKKPSVRFNAFKMISKIAKGRPDLENEATLLAQEQYVGTLSSSAQKSITRMLKEIKSEGRSDSWA